MKVRLAWLHCSTSLRQALLEGGVVAAFGLGVAFVIAGSRYEGTTTLGNVSTEPKHIAELVAIANESASRVAGARVRIGAETLGPNNVRLVCRADDEHVAREACARAVADMARQAQTPRMSVAPVEVSEVDDTNPPWTSWLLLSAAVTWSLIRIRQATTRRPSCDETSEASGYWSIERELPREDGTERQLETPPPRFVQNIHTKATRRIQPVRSIIDVHEPVDATLGTAVADRNNGRTPAGTALLSERRLSPSLSQTKAARVASLCMRVVFRVGGNLYRPDSAVLNGQTQSQLRELAGRLLGCRAADAARVIRVASGVDGRYAKSQIAAFLAGTLAQDCGQPVLLAEGDMDSPSLQRVMGMEAPHGLGCTEQVERLASNAGRGTLCVMRIEGNLHALLESRNSSPAALGLDIFGEVIQSLRNEHAFIVIDGPVIDTWPDATSLAACVDHVVMVATAGTHMQETLALAQQHFRLEAMLGVVTAGERMATG